MGADPREILNKLIPDDAVIPDDFDDLLLWKIIINIVTEPPKRKKLPDVNTLIDVVELLKTSKKIMVLTGAGVSGTITWIYAVLCLILKSRKLNGAVNEGNL